MKALVMEIHLFLSFAAERVVWKHSNLVVTFLAEIAVAEEINFLSPELLLK